MPKPESNIDQQLLQEQTFQKLRKARAGVKSGEDRVNEAKEDLKAARGELRDAQADLYLMIDRLNAPPISADPSKPLFADPVAAERERRLLEGDETSTTSAREAAAGKEKKRSAKKK